MTFDKFDRTVKRSVDECNLCGMCNLACPVYSVLLKESVSPRFKAFTSKKQEYKEIFYLCTNCGNCIRHCPANIDLACQTIRKKLINIGLETPENKKMRENIKEYGNPFGKIKKGARFEQYYT